jgi:hypothetical protein
MTLHAEWDINYIRKPCPDNIRVDDVLLKAHKDNYALVLQADLFLHNYKVEWMIKDKKILIKLIIRN